MKNKKPVSTIQRYVPETNTWVQAGQLPHVVFNCTCIMASDKVHVMGRHDEYSKLSELFFVYCMKCLNCNSHYICNNYGTAMIIVYIFIS